MQRLSQRYLHILQFGVLGVPPWSLCRQANPTILRLLPLRFSCLRGTFASIGVNDLVLTVLFLTNPDQSSPVSLGGYDLFSSILTFRRVDLTNVHLFQPIWFRNTAPWMGHLGSLRCLNMTKLGAIPLLLACALEVQHPPCKRGISTILAGYTP